jgi:hypothetical protein
MEYVAAAMALISAYSSIKGGMSGKKGAQKASTIQAGQELELTVAKIEDLKLEERNLAGQTRAGAAGAGVKIGKGSPLQILAEQARNFQRERQTVAKVGATNASVINQRGQMVGKQAAYQGIGQGAQQLSNAFSLFARSG